jgi:hypothetical protein
VVSVADQYPYNYGQLTVSTSDISIVGNGSIIQAATGGGFVLDDVSGVSGVTVSGFTVVGYGSSVVQVIGSHDTTLDTIDATAEGSTSGGAISMQGPGSVAMIVDVEGYFTSGAGSSAYLPIDQDTSGDVLPGVTALVLNSTVTNVTAGGYLTVFPDNTRDRRLHLHGELAGVQQVAVQGKR